MTRKCGRESFGLVRGARGESQVNSLLMERSPWASFFLLKNCKTGTCLLNKMQYRSTQKEKGALAATPGSGTVCVPLLARGAWVLPACRDVQTSRRYRPATFTAHVGPF